MPRFPQPKARGRLRPITFEASLSHSLCLVILCSAEETDEVVIPQEHRAQVETLSTRSSSVAPSQSNPVKEDTRRREQRWLVLACLVYNARTHPSLDSYAVLQVRSSHCRSCSRRRQAERGGKPYWRHFPLSEIQTVLQKSQREPLALCYYFQNQRE